MKGIDKERRLSPKDYKRYIEWLADYQPRCQVCNKCSDDLHHVLFGAYKDDRTLVSLCREHHSQAHKDKRAWEKILLPIAQENWKTYNNLSEIKETRE